tara:strand:+ start:332 stop:1660 length:1329 start_codon:yes stop_codon:yes gene_type:complete
MKKTLFLFFTIIGLTLSAQQEAPPQGINYQAVVYSDNGNNQPGLNSPGQVLWNEDIGVQFSILSGSSTGTVIYKETHATSTDEFGMFDLVIGQGLVQGTQSFNMIDWGSGYHFLKVEVDKTGGTDYVEMSNQQLWSVPYALYSGYSSSSGYADSSAYADIAGNGLTGVADNGDGTLTFTYYDGSTYTTTVLSGLGGVGPQGPAGADGQDGQDGLSAYEIWISQGNTGTEQDFLNSLEGLQGPAGTNGVDGVDGANGVDGGNRKAIGTVGPETWSVPGWSIEYTTGGYIYPGRIYYTPIFVSDTTTYTGLGIQMGSQFVNVFDLKVGMYSWSNGLPDTLMYELGTFETNIPSGHIISNSFTLNPGYYFLTYVASSGSAIYPNSATRYSPPVSGKSSTINGETDCVTLSIGAPNTATSITSNGFPNIAVTPNEYSCICAIYFRE